MNAQQIKQKSIEQLQEEGIRYIEHLPALFDVEEVQMRTTEEIAKRFIAAILVTTMCFEIQNGTKDENMEWLENMFKKFSIQTDDLTEKEKNILYGEPTGQDLVNGTWKYEAEWILFWALGFSDEIGFPDSIAPTNSMIQFLASCKNLQEVIWKAKIRNKEEILQMADLFYRYHWVVTDYRVNGQEIGRDMNTGVVMERRAGLWWLIFSHDKEISDWDNPDYST